MAACKVLQAVDTGQWTLDSGWPCQNRDGGAVVGDELRDPLVITGLFAGTTVAAIQNEECTQPSQMEQIIPVWSLSGKVTTMLTGAIKSATVRWLQPRRVVSDLTGDSPVSISFPLQGYLHVSAANLQRPLTSQWG